MATTSTNHSTLPSRTFISHLYDALVEAGITTFKDDSALEKGEEISSELINAIKDSNILVVVLSENFAPSAWCLNELVAILGCKKTNNHVLPVFYYVDPMVIRHQTGACGEALEKHKIRYSVNVIKNWKSALTEIGNLYGYHLILESNGSFHADLPNSVIADWFSYKSEGCTVCFDIPSNLGDNFLGLALWVVYKCSTTDSYPFFNALIMNATVSTKMIHRISNPIDSVHAAQSRIECIRVDQISVRSGDLIIVSFGKQLYSDHNEATSGGVQVSAGYLELCSHFSTSKKLSL